MTTTDDSQDASASALTDPVELLLRQVHPSELDEVVTIQSSAFRPGSTDEGLLSTRREAAGAQAAYEEWLAQGHATAGTWGVAVGEVSSNGLACIDDEHLPDNPPHHVSIDFSQLSRGARTRAGRLLRDAAVARGRLHPED